jgi:hypothetical protein
MCRGLRRPALPVVSTLGVVVCGAMIYGLGWTNWLRLGAWLVIGLVLYFGYARSHSKLARRRGSLRVDVDELTECGCSIRTCQSVDS